MPETAPRSLPDPVPHARPQTQVSLLAIRVGRRWRGRVAELRIIAPTAVLVELSLERHGEVLAQRHYERVAPGPQSLWLRVPRPVEAGHATLRAVVRDESQLSCGGTAPQPTTLQPRVFVPAR